MDITKLDTRTLIAAVNKEALRETQKNGRKGTISAKTVKVVNNKINAIVKDNIFFISKPPQL